MANGCSDPYLAKLRQIAGRHASVEIVDGTGVALARNHGARLATGEWLLFIDDDDVIMPFAIEALRTGAGAHEHAAAVVGTVFLWSSDPNFDRTVNRFSVDAEVVSFERLLLGTPTESVGSALIRRAAFFECGAFDQSVAPAEDWDLWFKLANVGPILGITATTLKYRIHTTNVSRSVATMALQALRVLQRHEKSRVFTNAWNLRLAAMNALSAWYVPRLRNFLSESVKLKAGRSLVLGIRALAAFRLTLLWRRFNVHVLPRGRAAK